MSEEAKEQSRAEFAFSVTMKIIGVLVALYFFLAGLSLMGGSFGALGGKGASELFTITDNPITGLMVGILATVMVQSSSTSSSIVVGLVGADVMSPRQAIPVIMGANIGTSVTNTIVSMAHSGDRLELERAFSGATVHDVFNMLSVLTLLPLEVISAAASGEGGLLYWISKGLTETALGESELDLTFPSPTKELVDPLVKAVLVRDKNVVKALSLGAPPSHSSGTYYCVTSAMSQAWKKVAEDAYDTLTSCSGFVHECADGSSCYTDAGTYYESEIAGARIIGKGFLRNAGDSGGGIIGLFVSFFLMCGALYVLVQLLQSLVMGHAMRVVMNCTKMNDYLAMLLGLVITIIVQSSSVTTSALTPLVGIGVLPVHKMLPMTLGANIGTTFTSILAAFAVMKFNSIQIAFCHLLFNVIGILIWFPAPMMRRVIVKAACTLGFYASYWRVVPLIYIVVMFVGLPSLILAISVLYELSVAAGIVVTILALGAVAGFVFWWVRLGGCYQVVSQEEREARKAEIDAEMGISDEKEAEAEPSAAAEVVVWSFSHSQQ